MAGQLISMTLEDGGDETAVVFEVDGALAGSDLDLAADDGLVGRARISVQEALDQVKPTLARVARTVRELGPDEAEIEFGLKMGGETGIIVAKGTAEVNFAVRLVWHRA
ncbi:CU044_2847 family protein [Streptomyces sp. NPDC006514]|uniref:CU044_2847 family protein n=1 Tax=unclassified Streptomyces TaxID=2593676 RepID=UPI0033ADFD12